MANEVIPSAEAPAKPPETVTPPPAAAAIPPAAPPPNSTPADKPAEGTATPPPPADPKPGEGKKDEPAPKPDDKPADVKYDLKLKDGTFLDAKEVEQVTEQAKKLGLNQDQAQALLDAKDDAKLAFAQHQKTTLDARAEEWVTEVKNDPELGGDGYNENVENAKRFVQKFGSDSFRKTLEDTKLGSHPELIRVFARAGKMLAEDKTVFPGSKGSGTEKRPIEDILYGDPKTKK